jgi:RNA polymerase sigma factor (sigma-70 family)
MNVEEQLLEEYSYLIPITLRKLFGNVERFAQSKHLEKDDLMQYGRMGLLNSIRTFDSTKTKSLRNHCIRNIRWYVMREVERDQMVTTYYKYNHNANGNENKKFNTISMSSKPFRDSNEDQSFYDVVDSDNINGVDESVETKAVFSVELDKMLSVLKEKDKELFLLSLEGLDCEQIAKIYGVKRQGIHVKLQRIKKQLKRHMGVATT